MKLLDLFCGAGGCAEGYRRCGFTEIVGVDLYPQKRYPFTFIQADAMEFLETVKAGDFDCIHASPPCQGYSRMRHLPWLKGRVWPLLIEPVRVELERIGTPWIIENVEDAPLGGIVLCGATLGLKCYRHRRFESSFELSAPPHKTHRKVIDPGRMLNDRDQSSPDGWVSLLSKGKKADVEAAVGIDWMTKAELTDAIPPAYTEYVGKQALDYLRGSGLSL